MEYLHEFDPTKLITKEIDPKVITPINYKPYEKNSLGSTIIDKNKDLSSFRSLINLYTTKYSTSKFNEIIDSEFVEFAVPVTDNSLELAQNQIALLQAELNRALSKQTVDEKQIADLLERIQLLNEQINNLRDTSSKNSIPDTLAAGGFLYSDRTGLPGAPSAPKSQNSLLSANRMAKATIQSDGNFLVETGEFTFDGTRLSSKAVTFARGYNPEPGGVYFVTVEAGLNARLASRFSVGRLRSDLAPTNGYRNNWSSPSFSTASTAVRLVLDDSGILSLYDDKTIIWSSYGQSVY
jgi:hypothetical protein